MLVSLLSLNKLIHSPYILYHAEYYEESCMEYLHYDILTVLVIKEIEKQNNLSFSSFSDHDYIKILNLIVGRDFAF